MRRLLRVSRKVALVLGVLAAVLALPASAQAAHGQAAADGQAAAGRDAATTVAATSTTSSQAGSAGTVGSAGANSAAAGNVSAAASGLCSVPGIGDIGGLLGLCSKGSGLFGALNNICSPSLPQPEPANSGIDAMVAPPSTGKPPKTLYAQYGVAGDYWAATNLQCSDMTSLIGNNVAGMVFDVAKSIDRVTITVYQSAAGEGILSWLSNVTDRLITSLGKAIYFPYVAVVVILGAIWLAWQGLIRKRGTRTIEGTIWMVVAAAAAIFLIGKPAELTGLGRGVSDGITQALNAAFAKLPSSGPSSCVPVGKSDPQEQNFAYTSGSTVVDQNANQLWTVLVCKPWLDGELGTTTYAKHGGKPTIVDKVGRQLLWAQAIAVNEKPTAAVIKAKQFTYAGIANTIQRSNPSVYPLFQGKQWTTRMEIAFAALFAALVAGVLILLISVTLILLKLSFLLLLIVGPFFLLIGTHPGFGRVVAVRWVEMLIGVLLKQGAIALVLSVLLYCYTLIMGTADNVLPWALKILMIALVTVAAFIYRKPFTHLFSAVGYGVIGSQERAEADLQRAGSAARGNTRAAATLAVPGFAAYRAARWARQNPAQAASLALSASTAAGVAAGARTAAGAAGAAGDGAGAEGAEGSPGAEDAAAAAAVGEANGTRAAAAAKARAWPNAGAEDASGRQQPPPLNLPSRSGAASAATGAAKASAARTGVGSATAGRQAPSLPATAARSAAGGGSAAGAGPAAGTGSAAPVGAAGSAPASASAPAGGGGIWPSRPATRQSVAAAASGSAPAAPPPAAPAPAPPRQPAAPRQAPPPRQRAARRPASSSPWGPGSSAPPPAAPPPPAPPPPAPAPPRRAAPPPVAPAPAPARQAAAPRPAAPREAARPARQAPASPAPARSGWGRPSASRPRQRQAERASSGDDRGDSGETAGGPLSGSVDGEAAGPFWLRPLRRRD